MYKKYFLNKFFFFFFFFFLPCPVAVFDFWKVSGRVRHTNDTRRVSKARAFVAHKRDTNLSVSEATAITAKLLVERAAVYHILLNKTFSI